jgi:hypothetical protein
MAKIYLAVEALIKSEWICLLPGWSLMRVMVVDGRVLGSCDTRLWGTLATCSHVSGCPRRPAVPRTPPNIEAKQR